MFRGCSGRVRSGIGLILPLPEQNVAGAVDLAGEIIAAAVIGVELFHQPVMRLPDRFLRRSGREAEDCVGLVDRNIGSGGGAGSGIGAEPRIASETLAPGGMGAVGI